MAYGLTGVSLYVNLWDYEKQLSVMKFSFVDDTKVDAFIIELAKLTNAKITGYSVVSEYLDPALDKGTKADFSHTEDKALITFTKGDGTASRLMIPAPIKTNFKTDGETIDFTKADVISFKTALGNLLGSTIQWNKGKLVRKNRKENPYAEQQPEV